MARLWPDCGQIGPDWARLGQIGPDCDQIVARLWPDCGRIFKSLLKSNQYIAFFSVLANKAINKLLNIKKATIIFLMQKKEIDVFTMYHSLLKQFKKRRLQLNFKQSDMGVRLGISRQQYQHLESKGNPRLSTLKLIAAGLNSELMLIPKDKLDIVQAILAGDITSLPNKQEKDLSEDPWQDFWEDNE